MRAGMLDKAAHFLLPAKARPMFDLIRTRRDLNFATLSAAFHALALCGGAGLTDSIAEAPKGSRSGVGRHCSALMVEPDCRLAVFGIFGAIL